MYYYAVVVDSSERRGVRASFAAGQRCGGEFRGRPRGGAQVSVAAGQKGAHAGERHDRPVVRHGDELCGQPVVRRRADTV